MSAKSTEGGARALGVDGAPHDVKRGDAQQLALLMQYTIFHIGTYIALAGVGLAVLRDKGSAWMLLPIILFLVAGMSGSVVGSNIPRFDSYAEFMAARIGVGQREHLPPKIWMALEHTSFWLGLLQGLVIVLLN